MRALVGMMKALSDANRLRAICALGERELCLCQIVELLGLASLTVSRHMSLLQQARLVESRKEGRWTYFRLAADDAPAEAREAIALVARALQEDRAARDDLRRLQKILKLDREELCGRHGKCKP